MNAIPTTVRRNARELAGGILDLILPRRCLGCAAFGEELCSNCSRDLVAVAAGGCRRCGEPLAPDGTCVADHRALRNLRQLLAPFRFAGTGGRLVRRFKLDADVAAGRRLARAMADCVRMRGDAGRPVLVAVPLHRARRRRRGFDQAQWLASRVASLLQLRAGTGILVRSRPTRPQGDAMVLSRAANVRGVFSVRQPGAVTGRQVLLVDDVFTTGATARECATQLRQAGAAGVTMLVACRSRAGGVDQP